MQDRRITPFGVWDILKSKIEVCDIVVALVSKDAFGTIVEAAYAAGKGNSAVYVFPAPGVEIDEQEELWFPFNLSLSTKKMWKRLHFEMEGLFPVKTTMEEYEARIRCITPNFLKRHSDE